MRKIKQKNQEYSSFEMRLEAVVDAIAYHPLNRKRFQRNYKKGVHLRRFKGYRGILKRVFKSSVRDDKIILNFCGVSHLDAAWLWPVVDTKIRAYKTFYKAVEHCEEFPFFTFAETSPQYYNWIKKYDPKLWQKVKEKVKEGRIEPTGGMWIEPSLDLPSGESLVRQRLYGQLFYLREFGFYPKLSSLLDVFGFPWSLPQILVKSGAEYFWTTKNMWNDEVPWPVSFYYWKGIDGSQIFTYQFTFNWDAIGNLSRFKKTARFPKPKYYGTEINSRMTEAEIQERFLNSGKSSDFNHNLAVFYGIGDGGRGPLELEIMYADALVKLHNGRHVSQHQFFREQKEYVGERYLIWNDEQYLEFHRGVKTTQAMMKHLHRRAEYIANASENLVTMNNLINPDFTNIDKNIIFEFWRKVLFNEFHDILPGSSIPDVYRLARKEMKLSIESSMELIAENLVLLKEKANLSLGHKEDSEFQQEHEQKNDAKTSSAITGSKSKNYNYRYAIVYNPSCWERSGYALANPNHISYAHDEGMNKIFMAKGDTSLEGNNNNSNENGGKYIYHFKDLPPLSVTLQEIEYLCSSPDNNPIIKNEKESPFNEIYKESEEFFVLENDYIKATIDKKKGSLVSLKLKNASKDNNKGTDYEFLYTENTYKNMGAGLRIFSENPKQYPAWNLDKYYPTKKVPYYIVGEAYLKTNEAGIKVVHVDFAFGNNKKSKLFIEFFLLPEDKFLRIRIHTDIKDKKVLVKYFVPLTIKSEWVTAEIPYASIERRRFKKSEREKAKWEMPMQKWIDISDSDSGENSVGLAIINDNRYGFNATRKGVYISIVRTPKYPGVSPLYGATRTIPPSERPKYTDMEPLDFNILLYPHKGDWKEAKVWQEAHDFNLPIFFMPLEINQTETQEEKFNATINGLNEFNNKFGFEFLRIEDRDVNNIFVNVIKAPEWTGPNLDKLTENDDWTWDKKSFIVRMTEIYGKETEFTIKFSDKLKIKEVIGVNLLEMAENSEIDNNTTLIDGNRIKTRIGKYEIKTLLIKLK